MALSNYQLSYRGVTIGDGTVYDIVELEGLHSLSVSTGDRDNPRTHGVVPGLYTATYNLIRCKLEVRGDPGTSTHEDDIRALLDALSVDAHEEPDESDDKLTFQFPGEDELFVYARPTRRSRGRKNSTEFGLAPIEFELKQYDPRQYSTTLDDSGVQTSSFSVTNGGSARAYPIIQFGVDTLGGLTLNNTTNGSTFVVAGLTASENDFVADMGRWIRSRGDLLIIYKGSTNHYNKWLVPRNPFYLDPGVNNLQLVVSSNADVRIYSRATWM